MKLDKLFSDLKTNVYLVVEMEAWCTRENIMGKPRGFISIDVKKCLPGGASTVLESIELILSRPGSEVVREAIRLMDDVFDKYSTGPSSNL